MLTGGDTACDSSCDDHDDQGVSRSAAERGVTTRAIALRLPAYPLIRKAGETAVDYNAGADTFRSRPHEPSNQPGRGTTRIAIVRRPG